jgi:hypothetical protein
VQDLVVSDLSADCFANDCSARTAVDPLILDSGFAPEADCAVVEHDEAAMKATRVLVGVNRG